MNSNDKFNELLEDSKLDLDFERLAENETAEKQILKKFVSLINQNVTLTVCPNDLNKMPIAGIHTGLLTEILKDFLIECNKTL